MVDAPPPPKPAAIVRAWSRDLNANDNLAAAQLFARNARVIQPPYGGRLTSAEAALEFNASLPCAGRIVKLTVRGKRVTAVFVLGHRPKHTCDGPGQKAAAVFVVENGLITLWEQIPVPQQLPA
jgi:SnoaL-like domain